MIFSTPLLFTMVSVFPEDVPPSSSSAASNAAA